MYRYSDKIEMELPWTKPLRVRFGTFKLLEETRIKASKWWSLPSCPHWFQALSARISLR